MISIAGYRITKLKKEISLTTNRYIPFDRMNENTNKNSINEAIDLLNKKVNYIIDVLKENGLIGSDDE
jgi:hypothetical protein